MRDYLSAIDDVSKEAYVDSDRLGLVGASYGGYSAYYTAFSGGKSELLSSSGSAWDISQFWQNRQWRLHPAVATEKALDPGRK